MEKKDRIKDRKRNFIHRPGKGFTMVELIVVLVILAVIAAVAVPVFLGYINSAKDKDFIADSQAALTSTQAALTEVYNDGRNRLDPERRDKAERESGVEYGKTRFTVWTASALVDGSTKAVSDNISSYTVEYAEYVSETGKVVVYNGKDWTVYDTAQKAAGDESVKNRKSDNVIYVWIPGSKEQPKRLIADGEDSAYKSGIGYRGKEDWQETTESGNPSYVDVRFEGWAGTDTDVKLVTFVKNENRASSLDMIATKSDGFGVQKDGISLDLNKDYDGTTLKWSFMDSENVVHSFDNIIKVEEYLQSQTQEFFEKTTAITLKPEMAHGFIDIKVAFAPYNHNTQTVTVTGNGEGEDPNTVTVKYDKVEKQFTDSIDKLDAVQVTVTPNAGKGVGAITQSGKWLIQLNGQEEDGEPVFEKDGNAYQAKSLNEIKAYVSQVDPTTVSEISFETPADIHKTVYLRGKDKAGNLVATFNSDVLTANNPKVFDITFTQNEKLSEDILTPSNTPARLSGTNPYSILSGAGMNCGTTTVSLNGAVKQNKPKVWNLYDCDKDGGNETLLDDPTILDADCTKEVLTRLFDDPDEYGMVAEAELDYLNSLLAHTEKITYTGNDQTAVPFAEQFKELAGGDATKIEKILFTTKASRPYYESKYRELCLSDTLLKTDSTYELSVSDGDYVKDPDHINPEYPRYIVGYSVDPNGTGRYTIYVFTEDDSDMKAINCLARGFDGFTEMNENDFVEHLETSEADRFMGFFRGCSSLTSVDLSGIAITGSTDDSSMFEGCTQLSDFHPSSSGFDTGNNRYFQAMFKGCAGLTAEKIPTIDLSHAYDIVEMFSGCTSLTSATLTGPGNDESSSIPLGIETGNYTGRSGGECVQAVFDNCTSLTSITLKDMYAPYLGTPSGFFDCEGTRDHVQEVTIEAVTLPNATSVSSMLKNYTALRYVDLHSFALGSDSSQIDATSLFEGCTALTGATGTVNGANHRLDMSGFSDHLSTMDSMFKGCIKLGTVAPTGLVTTQAKSMESMFEGCTALTGTGESGFHIDSAENITMLFKSCSNIVSASLIGGGNTTDSRLKSCGAVFDGCDKLDTCSISNLRTTQLTSLNGFFEYTKTKKLKTVSMADVSISNVNSMANLLNGSPALEKVTFSNVQASNNTSCASMFSGDTKLKYVDLSGLMVSQSLASLESMFSGCILLTGNDTTGNKLDLSGLLPSDAEDMNVGMKSMFQGCTALTTTSVRGLKTGFATNMESMFMSCTSLTGTTLHIDRTTTVVNLFNGCTGLKDVVFVGAGKDSTVTCQITDTNCTDIFKSAPVETFTIRDICLAKFSADSDAASGLHVMMRSLRKTVKTFRLLDTKLPELKTMSFLFLEKSESKNTNGCTNLQTIEFNGIDAPKLYRFKGMAQKQNSLTTFIMKSFNMTTTANVNFSLALRGCRQLKNVDFGSLEDGSAVTFAKATDFNDLFTNCSGLEVLDLSGFNNNNKITAAKVIFAGCTSLRTIYVSDSDLGYGLRMDTSVGNQGDAGQDISEFQQLKGMFKGCEQLVGGNGTTYNVNNVGSEYAKADKPGQSGYFTIKKRTNLKQFDQNWFNNDLQERQTFTGFMRDQSAALPVPVSEAKNIAASGEPYPVYVWNDNGVIKWWSEADVICMHPESKSMFYRWAQLQTVDLSGISFAGMKNFSYMFADCTSLTSVDLSTVNMSSATTFELMFSGDTALTSVKFPTKVDFSGVKSVCKMFQNNTNLPAAQIKAVVATWDMTNKNDELTLEYVEEESSPNRLIGWKSSGDFSTIQDDWYSYDGRRFRIGGDYTKSKADQCLVEITGE